MTAPSLERRLILRLLTLFLGTVAAAVAAYLFVGLFVGSADIEDGVAAWVWHEVGEELLPLLSPLLLGSLIIVPWTVRRSLAPLRDISAKVAAIGPGERGSGLHAALVPREVAPLVTAIDQALDRLQEALARQRRFTANAAHELRTPLAVLRARLDGMPASPERGALLRDAARMTRLVEQLLAMARLEAGQATAEEDVDLCEVCRDVVAELAPLAISEGKEIALEAPPSAPRRRGGRGALAEALRNLLDNALRVSPPAGVVTVMVAPDGLVVRDQGPGVPPEHRERLFEPFWRGAQGGGAGLGLALVAETAAAYGGSVMVADAPGGGAEFRLLLPAAQV